MTAPTKPLPSSRFSLRGLFTAVPPWILRGSPATLRTRDDGGVVALCQEGQLAAVQASRFTVFTYDRRGRGESGNTPPYAVEREVEDLQAVIDVAGGSADVYGISSGGVPALEAANRLDSIRRLALYELSFVTDDSRKPIPDDFAAQLAELAENDRRAEALRYFFTAGIGLPRITVAMMRVMPVWSKLTALAHTLPCDAQLISDASAGGPLPADRWPPSRSPPW